VKEAGTTGVTRMGGEEGIMANKERETVLRGQLRLTTLHDVQVGILVRCPTLVIIVVDHGGELPGSQWPAPSGVPQLVPAHPQPCILAVPEKLCARASRPRAHGVANLGSWNPGLVVDALTTLAADAPVKSLNRPAGRNR
jgi:hypothetical protein